MDTFLPKSGVRLVATPTGSLVIEQDARSIIVFAAEVREFVLTAAQAVQRLDDSYDDPRA